MNTTGKRNTPLSTGLMAFGISQLPVKLIDILLYKRMLDISKGKQIDARRMKCKCTYIFGNTCVDVLLHLGTS